MNLEEIFSELLNVGCCNRCSLRLLGDKYSNFENSEQSLIDLLPVTSEDQVRTKRVRRNPCCLCLGLLEDAFLYQIMGHSCWCDIQDYDSDSFRINLNTPANICIRDRAMHLYIKQKFPDFYELQNSKEIILNMHETFKIAFKAKLEKHCGKTYDVYSGIQLWVTVHHDDYEKEVEVMQFLDPQTYKRRKSLKFMKTFAKNAVKETLGKVDDHTFLKFVKIPPSIPSSSVKLVSVDLECLPLFVTGRYCKYSRLIKQVPWDYHVSSNTESTVLPKTESDTTDTCTDFDSVNCVRNIIFDGLRRVLRLDKEKMTFCASGRDEPNMRCLGSGRPFCVKIEIPRKHLPDELFRELEETINESPDVAVFDMQLTNKSCLSKIKCGEEMKKKGYTLLCLIRQPRYVEEVIQIINKIGCNSLCIQQFTPVRFSNRRPIHLKSKYIFCMKAMEVPGHHDLFQLTMVTQAGTWINEFLTGDFGRTFPNLSNMVHAELDILRIDLIGVDCDWPPVINSIPHPAMNRYSHLHRESQELKPGTSTDRSCEYFVKRGSSTYVKEEPI